jgi:hypothetical protein
VFDSKNRNPMEQLKRLLTGEVSRGSDYRNLFWLGLSLAFSIAFASRAMEQAFSSQYVLQDDWRHHVFWTSRLVDPELFPRDVIADYFQSVAPLGYAALYRVTVWVGLDPFVFSKLLPMVLGLATTFFCFGVSGQILRVPAAGFIGSLLLNQSLWMRNGLVSATPRAFICPLLLGFIYFLLRRWKAASLVTVGLMGLLFPSTMFIAIAVLCLRLVRWEGGRLCLSRERSDYVFCAMGLTIAILVLLPYAFRSSEFGPVVTAAEGREMPEFRPGGRMTVFRQDFLSYWLIGNHTGMFSAAVFSPLALSLGLLLPIIIFFPRRFPLVARLSGGLSIFPRVILASIGMFFAANLLLFRLYLPSRFTVNSFRILLALAAGISAIIALDAIFRWANRRPLVIFVSIGLLAAALGQTFVTRTVVDTRYKIGQSPQLYEYLLGQPKDTLIASLSNDAENLPIFARRSILVGQQIALPFHKGYYSQIRQRAVDLINAQYSSDLVELQSFIQKYGVDYLLVDGDAFTPEYVTNDRWIKQYQPAARDAAERMKQGIVPALERLVEQCSILESKGAVLIPAECVMKASVNNVSSGGSAPAGLSNHNPR